MLCIKQSNTEQQYETLSSTIVNETKCWNNYNISTFLCCILNNAVFKYILIETSQATNQIFKKPLSSH